MTDRGLDVVVDICPGSNTLYCVKIMRASLSVHSQNITTCIKGGLSDEMYCNDPEVMSSNPSRVELGVYSMFVLSNLCVLEPIMNLPS